MVRLILGVVAGAIGWIATVAVVGFIVGKLWPEFAMAARDPSRLTFEIMVGRLAVSVVATIVGGLVAALVGQDRGRASLAMGVLLLAFFVPYHVFTPIWQNFPLWYHLTFFVSLPLFALLGGRLAPAR